MPAYNVPGYIWFNKAVDTVLFGETTCKYTMKRVFHEELGFTKVAIVISDKAPRPCQEPVRIIEALHGERHESPASAHLNAPGCEDLKQIFFVLRCDTRDIPDLQVVCFVPSTIRSNVATWKWSMGSHDQCLCHLDLAWYNAQFSNTLLTRRQDPTTCFRHTTFKARTDQARLTQNEYSIIFKECRAGNPLSTFCWNISGRDRWSQGSGMPRFYFTFLTPTLGPSIVIPTLIPYRYLALNVSPNIGNLLFNRTGCYIDGLYNKPGSSGHVYLSGPDYATLRKGVAQAEVLMVSSCSDSFYLQFVADKCLGHYRSKDCTYLGNSSTGGKTEKKGLSVINLLPQMELSGFLLLARGVEYLFVLFWFSSLFYQCLHKWRGLPNLYVQILKLRPDCTQPLLIRINKNLMLMMLHPHVLVNCTEELSGTAKTPAFLQFISARFCCSSKLLWLILTLICAYCWHDESPSHYHRKVWMPLLDECIRFES